MRAFIGRFFVVLGIVVGILALYVAATPLHLEWLVVVAVLAAAGIAAIPVLIRPLGRAIAAVVRYPALVRHVGEVDAQLEEARQEVATLRATAQSRYEEGMKFGVRQFLGHALGQVSKVPKLVAISGDAGHLKLIGEYDEGEDVIVGAWFNAVVAVTGDKRGVVEVIGVDKESRKVELGCVERTSDGFWGALEQRIEADPSPPAGIELRPIPAPSPGSAR